MKIQTFVAGAIAVAWLGIAAAQPAERGSGACRADAEKFCKDVKPGDGRIVQCLAKNEAQLSPACRDDMAKARQHRAKERGEHRERGKEFIAACKADADKHCQGVKPGDGRIVRCLSEKKDQLSPGCKTQMERGPAGKN